MVSNNIRKVLIKTFRNLFIMLIQFLHARSEHQQIPHQYIQGYNLIKSIQKHITTSYIINVILNCQTNISVSNNFISINLQDVLL